MAEALFEDRLVKSYPQLFPMVRMDSAGTMGIEGNRVTETAVQTMDLWGIDLSRHRAQPLDIRMAQEADLILTMAREHLLSIERLGGKYLGKAYSLKYLASRREAASGPAGHRFGQGRRRAGQAHGAAENVAGSRTGQGQRLGYRDTHL